MSYNCEEELATALDIIESLLTEWGSNKDALIASEEAHDFLRSHGIEIPEP